MAYLSYCFNISLLLVVSLRCARSSLGWYGALSFPFIYPCPSAGVIGVGYLLERLSHYFIVKTVYNSRFIVLSTDNRA